MIVDHDIFKKFYSENVMTNVIEIEKEADSENAFVQRGCATVVNDKMMYFGGSIDPMQVWHFSYNFCIYVTTISYELYHITHIT